MKAVSPVLPSWIAPAVLTCKAGAHFSRLQRVPLDFVAGADFVEAAVADPADAIAGCEHFVVVGGADDGDAFFAVEGFHELDDFLTGFGVEVSGGFVGEDDAGRVARATPERQFSAGLQRDNLPI